MIIYEPLNVGNIKIAVIVLNVNCFLLELKHSFEVFGVIYIDSAHLVEDIPNIEVVVFIKGVLAFLYDFLNVVEVLDVYNAVVLVNILDNVVIDALHGVLFE